MDESKLFNFYEEFTMSIKHTTAHRDSGGKTHTTITRYNNGSSKSVTRSGGNVLSERVTTSIALHISLKIHFFIRYG